MTYTILQQGIRGAPRNRELMFGIANWYYIINLKVNTSTIWESNPSIPLVLSVQIRAIHNEYDKLQWGQVTLGGCQFQLSLSLSFTCSHSLPSHDW